MVVTRRQSAGPQADAASQSNSATGSSRSKGKGVDKAVSSKDPGAGPSRIPPNGTPSRGPTVTSQVKSEASDDHDVPSATARSPPPKVSAPVQKLKNRSKKLNRVKRHNSNKGISIFDILARLFLLWFTIYTLSVCPEDVELRSPVCRALTEYRRLILEPYVYPPIRTALDHPSIAPHIQRAQPYYHRAVQTTTPWILRGKYEWRTKVAPRIRWLQLRARPYVRRIERQYDATLGPYVRQASDVVVQYKGAAQPYVRAAILRTRRKWSRVSPFVLPLWRGALHVPSILTRVIGKPLGDAKKQWVDPQVTKIWAAVVEKGQADTLKATSTLVSRGSPVSSSNTFSSAFKSSIHNNESPASAGASNLPLDDPSTSSKGSSISLPPVPEPTTEAAASASSVVVDGASSPTSSSSAATSTASIDDAGDPSSTSSIEAAVDPSFTSSQTSAQPSSTDEEPPFTDGEDIEADLEEFLSEISAEDDAEAQEPPSPPPVHEETEEELAERLRLKQIETAEKRADIEARHDQWERDIEKFGRAQRKVVREALNRLREAAVEEARTPGAAIRIHVEALSKEAEKSLKSLKAYSKRLVAETKPESEKVKAWDNIVSKVDKKFGARVDAAADAVREWWNEHVNQEVREVKAIGDEVMGLAYQAQGDIGLDYSWLADVTYDDWQRYHKLVDTSKAFLDLYLSMQNGTHAKAPPNPLTDVMEALQEEVDDMIMGFDANLTRLKNDALDAFSGIETQTDRKVPKATDGSEPEASILPVEPVTENDAGEIPPVILSRGAEEVKAAVSMAEEARRQTAHEEL